MPILLFLILVLSLFAGGLMPDITGPGPAPTPEPLSVSKYTQPGSHPVGVTPAYFHDPDRPFDGWNANHATDNYQTTLKAINDAGENQIVAAHIWYPAAPGANARPATFDDFAQSASPAFRQAYDSSALFFLSGITNAQGQSAMDLAFSQPQTAQAIAAQLKERLVNSQYQAPIAPGNFPIIIAAHGLGGNSLMWTTFAEYLASHGYIVVAPSFISDSATPKVLDSPDSRFAQSATPDAVNAAYQTILGEQKVISGFFRYFFGQELPPAGPGNADGGGDGAPGMPPSLTAIPGGGQRVGQMMAEFFTQRVGDVATIIDGLESLNQPPADCRAQYAARGQTNHANQICGMFANALDLDRIGILGHSLGSMTAQFAVAQDHRLTAAVGYNNGPPRYWEPQGIFGHGLAPDGQPAGNPNPVMQIHGSEDAFVQNVFRGLMWNTLQAAGGDPLEIWTLEPEQAVPTNENPQPIARNAYTRATGDKIIISVKDVTHGTLVDDFLAAVTPENPITVNGEPYWNDIAPAARKPVGNDVFNPAFTGQPFTPLNWGQIEGQNVYLPAFIRNYYTLNWFDYYLKDDPTALRFLQNPIESQNILDIRSSITPK